MSCDGGSDRTVVVNVRGVEEGVDAGELGVCELACLEVGGTLGDEVENDTTHGAQGGTVLGEVGPEGGAGADAVGFLAGWGELFRVCWVDFGELAFVGEIVGDWGVRREERRGRWSGMLTDDGVVKGWSG